MATTPTANTGLTTGIPVSSGNSNDFLTNFLQGSGYGGGPVATSNPLSGGLGFPQGMERSIGPFIQGGAGYNPQIVDALIQSMYGYGNAQAQTSLNQMSQQFGVQAGDLAQYLQFAQQQLGQQIPQGLADITERYGGMGLGASSSAAEALAQYLQGANMDISQLGQSGALQLGNLGQTYATSAENMLTQNNAQLNALAQSTIGQSWQDAISNYLNIVDASQKTQGPTTAQTVASFLGGLF